MKTFITLFNWIRGWRLWGYLLAAIVVLLGLLKYEKYAKKRADKKLKKQKEAHAISEMEHAVKSYEDINNERKDVADEQLDKALDALDVKLNSSSTYSM